MVPAGEARDVADVADDGGGDNGADQSQVKVGRRHIRYVVDTTSDNVSTTQPGGRVKLHGRHPKADLRYRRVSARLSRDGFAISEPQQPAVGQHAAARPEYLCIESQTENARSCRESASLGRSRCRYSRRFHRSPWCPRTYRWRVTGAGTGWRASLTTSPGGNATRTRCRRLTPAGRAARHGPPTPRRAGRG